MDMFKFSDIKAGYLLVVEDGNKRYNMTVVPNREGELGCCCPQEEMWWPLVCFDINLRYAGAEITAIYGEASNANLLANETYGRTLLWRRQTTRLTHKEIEKRLGFKFEYVEEEA